MYVCVILQKLPTLSELIIISLFTWVSLVRNLSSWLGWQDREPQGCASLCLSLGCYVNTTSPVLLLLFFFFSFKIYLLLY